MASMWAPRWKARFTLLYAVSSWSLMAYVLYYPWSKRAEQLPPDEERTLVRETSVDAFFTSTITYKQNAAHPIADLYDKVKSFFATSDGPGPEE